MTDDPAKAIESVRSAWMILANGAPKAADALVDIAENGKSEMARVLAANAVLDRVGIPARQEISFRVTPEMGGETGTVLTPSEIIRNKLAEIRESTKAITAGEELTTGYLPAQTDDEIYEAELVEHPTTGLGDAGESDWR